MGVYVKGVEKPRSCGECFIGRRFMCEHVETFEDCPMVEVAEPHGRLIDADDLTPDEVAVDEMTFLAVEWDEIKAAPTVIEADEHRQLAEWPKELKECRQHIGHWVLVNRGLDIYMCDRCGEILQIDSVPIWDYCPVCGAKMGGYTDGRPNQQTGGD